MVWDFSADAAKSASPTLCFIIWITAFKVVSWLSLDSLKKKPKTQKWSSELFSSWLTTSMTPWELQPEYPAICLLLNFSSNCLRPNKYGKTEKAPHWKWISQYFETCVTLSENSHAASHGLQENTQQSPGGAGGLHPTEPFSHTFCLLTLSSKPGWETCFVRWGGWLLGEVVNNQHIGPMHSITEGSGKRQCSLILLIYLHSRSWRFKRKKKALGAQSTMPPKLFWCQQRLSS